MTNAASPATSDILACELALARVLLDRRELERWNYAWEEPAARWSQAVCDQASHLPPLQIASDEVTDGERIVKSPVFICGPPRSGTTLVRDLLDGHPTLAVLPAEGRFFGHFAPHGFAEQESLVRLECERWVQNLANPNHQRPFWLLGRSDSASSSYVRFARLFIAWSEALGRHDIGARAQAAAALALAQCKGSDIGALSSSVDKTPGYEFHLHWIRMRSPRAKIIYVLRDPREVAASYVAGLARTKLRSAPVSHMLRSVVSSHVALLCAATSARPGELLVVHYSRLVTSRKQEMKRIAAFLQIEWADTLLHQTIMGRQADPNSSFDGEPRPAFEPRSVHERAWLRLARHTSRMIGSRAVQEAPDADGARRLEPVASPVRSSL